MEKIGGSSYKAVILVASFVENIMQGKLRDIDAPNEYSSSEAITEFENRFHQTIEAIHATGAKVVVFTEPPRQLLNPINDYMKRTLPFWVSLPLPGSCFLLFSLLPVESDNPYKTHNDPLSFHRPQILRGDR